MTVYLLDVNLLLALTDPMHVHHRQAHEWFGRQGQSEWATCPLTENGFVRIASHPRYPNRPGDSALVLAVLRTFCSHPGHRFWPDAISLRNALSDDSAFSSDDITDLYLLGLAIDNEGKLATLDGRIPAELLSRGVDHLEIVPR